MITDRTARELARVSHKLWGRSIELRAGEISPKLAFATDGYFLVFIDKDALREPLLKSGFQPAEDREVELTKRWWQAWKRRRRKSEFQPSRLRLRGSDHA